MQDYLVFRLYGPLASWGELAVGEQRASAVYPSRSALLGLLGAALGIRRDDDAGQAALSESCRFGVKLVSAGLPLRDYHTVQSPELPKKFSYYTRKQEMRDKSKLGTILTSREYRCDSLAIVAVAGRDDATYDLATLAASLQSPVFVPYLGRKSCPLALPLAASVGQFASLKHALDSLDDTPPLPGVQLLVRNKDVQLVEKARYYWDAKIADSESGMRPTLQQLRHDQPLSRRRWQFETRQENVYLAEGRQ